MAILKIARMGHPILRGVADPVEDPTVPEVHRLIEGDRIVQVKVGSHFTDGVDTEEQLDAALGSLREECLHHIGKNKRVLIR